MKYIVLLGDGMADEPVFKLNDKTPLMVAKKPNMNFIAQNGEVGIIHTVPEEYSPGSDIANLSVIGYDPKKYYTGRSPLEALSIGVNLKETDVALRLNLVTLSEEQSNYEDKIITDHSSDEITTQEASELINALIKEIKNDEFEIYVGTSYRHCLVWKNGKTDLGLTPPHDILEKVISNYLPPKETTHNFYEFMRNSYKILSNHPINIKRKEKGLRPANSAWLWGEGTKPMLDPFEDKFGVKGAVISAVDLLKGIAIGADMKVIEVEGATGNIHTNFEGKARKTIEALKNGFDLVYLHIEAPDECGHRNEVENKVKSIEYIDQRVLKYLIQELNIFNDYKILLLPDHATPLNLRTHTRTPVPYVIYQKTKAIKSGFSSYDENILKKPSKVFTEGHKLMEYFIKNI